MPVDAAILAEDRSTRWECYLGYLVAFIGTALAAALRWGLDSLAGDAAPYVLFYFVIVAAAVIGGSGPGFVALGLSAVAGTWLFITPRRSLAIEDHADLIRILFFLASGGLISLVGGWARASRRSAQAQAAFSRRILESVTDGYFAVDREWLIIDTNGQAERVLSRPRQEFMGQDVRAWFPGPKVLFEVESARVMSERVARRFEEFCPATGKWFDISVYPADSGLAIFFRDITLQKKTNQELLESEDKFRNLTENMRAAVGVVQGTRFVYANRYMAEMLGYTVDEILSLDFPQLVRPDFREQMIDLARRRHSGEPVPGNYEFVALTKNGKERWLDFWPSRTIYKGQPAIIGAGFDITERKQMEITLRESEEKFRLLAENSRVPIVILKDRGFLYANPYLAAVSGYTREELLSLDIADLIPAEDRAAVLDRICRRQRGEALSPTYEYRLLDKSGQLHWVELSPVRIVYRGGEAILAAGSDVTGRRLAEDALKRAVAEQETLARERRELLDEVEKRAEELARANHAKDKFLAILSHELRTPLTPVLATVSMLQEELGLKPETQESLDVVRRNVELEARLIDDLLDLTRIACGKVHLNSRRVDLGKVIAQAVEVCRPDIEARQLHFGVEVRPNIPYWVDADVGRLQQVFWNLIKNSIKFTPHGGCVGVRCGPAGEGWVGVEVHDSGEGIEPEALERIFNAFEQAVQSRDRQFGGLGLGLAICKALVELHGGTIEAHSAGKGKGASFRVKLPLVSPPDGEAAARPGSRATESRPLRILLVEDHGDTARVWKRLLERRGHQVQTAGDVATALQLGISEPLDLVISDLGLPDASGLDLMRQLRERRPELKGIALSGYGMESDMARSREAGFSEHLTKPLDVQSLQAAIARVASSQ